MAQDMVNPTERTAATVSPELSEQDVAISDWVGPLIEDSRTAPLETLLVRYFENIVDPVIPGLGNVATSERRRDVAGIVAGVVSSAINYQKDLEQHISNVRELQKQGVREAKEREQRGDDEQRAREEQEKRDREMVEQANREQKQSNEANQLRSEREAKQAQREATTDEQSDKSSESSTKVRDKDKS